MAGYIHFTESGYIHFTTMVFFVSNKEHHRRMIKRSKFSVLYFLNEKNLTLN